MALFEFSLDGSVVPVNGSGKRLFDNPAPGRTVR